ncbi:TetR family transcriptional regulator [Bordetella genomosp. 10]|uniref:TetR family transcriptional regulator n=1 Tax=Bordetella genomosp. 10 TaxID=1416804 RepID=A0A261RZK2_9BORD|nr:TetR family transcriptional regulator C-terminal domain-containing protein [Bordetella genomosp. 10]OZI30082.1 TetR family transcriptional regulator [Bordetella genomosp. 10]
MDTKSPATRRGRRSQADAALAVVETRAILVRIGMEMLTEQGFSATGLDAILKRATVPKGSFYHYFKNKEDFGLQVMQAYDEYFRRKLDRWLLDDGVDPLRRIFNFVDDAKLGMARHGFSRGCLIGNFGQEVGTLPPAYRGYMNEILQAWEAKVAACFALARDAGQIRKDADCAALARFFWIGWEGAVLRARMMREPGPLDIFIQGFVNGVTP